MFVKLVYQQHFPNGNSVVSGVSIRECDEVYYEALSGTILDIAKNGEHEVINLDTMGPDLGPEPNENERYELSLMAYIMNDSGKTVDSFTLS